MSRSFAALGLLVGSLGAQVPDGFYVVSSMWAAALNRGPGGLFLVDPRSPVPPITVLGLGPDLRGTSSRASDGAGAVAMRGDGTILAGEINLGGAPVYFHEIVLRGATVASDRRTLVGTTGFGGGGIAELVTLRNGDALIAVQGLQSTAPLHGARLAVVHRSGGVTPVPTPILDHEYTLALAVDPSDSRAYLVVAPIEPHAVTLHEVPLPAGGSARRVGRFGAILTGLTFDTRGDLIACSTTDLHVIDIVRGSIRTLAALPPGAAVGIESEPASAGFALVTNGFNGPVSGAHHLDAGGSVTPLATTIPGVLSDVAVLPNPRTYGGVTAGSVRYDWQVAPAPGGIPQLGNAGFGLQVAASGGTLVPGAVFASPAPGHTRLLGVEVLLDVAGMFPIGTTDSTGALRLPIPLLAPIGATVFAQSFHLDRGAPGGVAATRGQRFQVMR